MRDWQQLYIDLEGRLDSTEKLLEKVVVENSLQKKEIAELKSKIENLTSENTSLSTDNIKLKERLGLNSKNSSIPSSKELYKEKQKNAKKSDRKQGAQQGHKANIRSKMAASEVIRIELESTECECGGKISLLDKTHVHQKIDIPKIVPHVTEYHLTKGRCGSCGKRKKAQLPRGVTNDLFGARIKSVIGGLTGFYKLSKREAVNILEHMLNIKISVGSISNNEARIARQCKESYEDIELELSYSKMLHIDETSHYNKGKLGWCWMFSSLNASLIKLTESRSKKVLEQSVFGSNDHLVITDRYAVYNYFNAENRQVCWAHLARDFERFAHSSYVEVKYLGEHLRDIAKELFALKKALEQEDIGEMLLLRRARKLRKRMWYYLKTMADKPGVLQAARVARNMIKSENMMWRFLDDPKNIPLTNNHAEQQIRHYVTYRKNSYFTQSMRGNHFLTPIMD